MLPRKGVWWWSPDATIDRLYHPLLEKYDTVLIGLGESVKTLQTVETIYRRFIELGVDRSTFVLAVGAGSSPTWRGFAASTYMRGLKFGFVSTTLLGQVDASVGGKERREHVDGYKNMAGTFTQPQFVICDPGCCGHFRTGSSARGWPRWSKRRSLPTPTCSDASKTRLSRRCAPIPDLLTDAVSAAIRNQGRHRQNRTSMSRGDRRKLNLGHTLAMPSRSAPTA